MDEVKLRDRGMKILLNSLLNKGTAFTQEERDGLGLNGLLPVHISTLAEQLKRCRVNFARRKTPLGKYLFLIDLLNRNEVLFYQFALKNAAELLPYIYTPTVGEAATQYSLVYTKQRGVCLSYPLMDRMEEMIANLPHREIDVIVATDGERILGLGDQGVGGMTISIGKLALYTIFGGIHPSKTLPIILDVGTNNEELLQNELYLGWHHKRITGAKYDEFIDRFIQAIQKRFPQAILQWEDFGKANAQRLLDKYSPKIPSFNDDIQGTGAVSLAAILSAVKVKHSKLADQRIAIFGGGSAGLGIAEMLIKEMQVEGLTRVESLKRIFIIDIHGLLHTDLREIDLNQRPFCHPTSLVKDWKVENSKKLSLLDVVKHVHPHILIGVSGQSKAFTKEIIDQMEGPHPIILPLSNPTSKAECTPEELIEWTKGQAIIATGSPFKPVEYLGRKRMIAQCNNVYIFPGLGLGALASGATQISDEMFLQAARILATFSPALKNPQAELLPAIEEVRAISRSIAKSVAQQACKEGLATISSSEIEARLDALTWEPHYPKYIPI